MIDKENALKFMDFLSKEILGKELSDKDKELIHPILKSTKRNFKTSKLFGVECYKEVVINTAQINKTLKQQKDYYVVQKKNNHQRDKHPIKS